MTLVVKDASLVLPFDLAGPLRGDSWSAVESQGVEDASVTCEGNRIAGLGGPGDAEELFDARGCTVIPGFVDCHTHLPFYGWRADEDAARLSGVRYESLHEEDGDIYRSARMLGDASDDEVIGFGMEQAGAMLRRGTTTFEMKSGYGLSVDAELRQLRLAARLAELLPQRVVRTCLAAHAVPKGSSQGEWVGRAASEILPVAAKEGLAVACDLFVEQIAFALEHAARLATAAEELGLAMRVHADQLADNQTASFAARWGFRSADHLNHTSPEGVGDLAESDTAAVLLPGATFTLRQNKKPPARDLVDSGAIVALASDFNPGSSPISSMPFVIALACRIYGLRPVEAVGAATVNGAYVLGLGDEVGRIAPDLRADLVVLEGKGLDSLAYRPDHDHVMAVVCGGQLVHVSERASSRAATR